MKDDDIPVVGLMVDLETAQFVFVALTKPATSLGLPVPKLSPEPAGRGRRDP